MLSPVLQRLRMLAMLHPAHRRRLPARSSPRIAHVAFPHQAGGSLIAARATRCVGSALIGQPFSAIRGTSGAGPRRPRRCRTTRAASSGSNLGPTNPALARGRGGARQGAARCRPRPVDARAGGPGDRLRAAASTRTSAPPRRSTRCRAWPGRARWSRSARPRPRRAPHRRPQLRHPRRAARQRARAEPGPRCAATARALSDRPTAPIPTRCSRASRREEAQEPPRPAEGLLRRRRRRRQDLRHARRGARASAPRASTSSSASSRRTAAPRPRRCSRAWRSCRAASSSYRGTTLAEFDLDAALARRPAPAPRRRARAHQRRRARATPSAGRTSRSCSTPASTSTRRSTSSTSRASTTSSRRSPACACARPCPTRCSTSADEVELVDLPPDELLERLQEGKVYLPEQARARRRELLPQGQPDRAARAGPAPHGRARRRADARLPRGPGHPRGRGPRRAAPGLRRARARTASRPRARRRAGSRRASTPSGSRSTWRRRAPAALPEAERDRILRTLRLAEELGAKSDRGRRRRRGRGGPRASRAAEQRHAHRGRTDQGRELAAASRRLDLGANPGPRRRHRCFGDRVGVPDDDPGDSRGTCWRSSRAHLGVPRTGRTRWHQVRAGRGRSPRRHWPGRRHVRALPARQHRHGLSRRRRGGRTLARAGGRRARRRALGAHVRLLLRPAVPVLRRERHRVPHHFRRHVGRGPRHLDAGGARKVAGAHRRPPGGARHRAFRHERGARGHRPARGPPAHQRSARGQRLLEPGGGAAARRRRPRSTAVGNGGARIAARRRCRDRPVGARSPAGGGIGHRHPRRHGHALRSARDRREGGRRGARPAAGQCATRVRPRAAPAPAGIREPDSASPCSGPGWPSRPGLRSWRPRPSRSATPCSPRSPTSCARRWRRSSAHPRRSPKAATPWRRPFASSSRPPSRRRRAT